MNAEKTDQRKNGGRWSVVSGRLEKNWAVIAACAVALAVIVSGGR